jgi:hypothetical protein
LRAAEGLNLIYAHRPLARRLVAQACERETPMGRMRIISVEVLIGFKLQSFVNDATRTRDLDDIRALLKTHRASLHMDELRGYFPCSINRNSSMNLSDSTNANTQTAPNRADAGAGAVLVREAGLPFQPPLGNASGIDPIAEWLA